MSWLRAHRRETIGSVAMAATVLTGFGLMAGPAGSSPRLPSAEERALAATPPPAVQPLLVRNVAPQTAMQLNAALPMAGGPNPAARPFNAPPVKSVAYARALECLTQAIYYEAARESVDGQRAVAQVVLNRARHPVYPASVCGVVYQGSERDTGCQFTFTCDGSLYRAPMRSYWDRARHVAHQALQGYVHAPVGLSTHYHTNYVLPYWASSLAKSVVVGTHIFYRWAGNWGRPPAFAQRYSGREADPYALKTASLAAEARDRATPDEVPEVVVQARQELPPELARLVDAEIGAKGESRVTMRIPANRTADSANKDSSVPVERAPSSANLRWTLTGEDPVAAAQTPLGAKAAPAESESADTGPAETGPAAGAL